MAIHTRRRFGEVTRGTLGTPISLMVDYGKVDLQIFRRLPRVAWSSTGWPAHKHEIPKAIELADQIAERGYKVALQLMGIGGIHTGGYGESYDAVGKSTITYVTCRQLRLSSSQ